MKARTLGTFVVASGFSAGLRFLAFPILASTMSPVEFGKVSLFLATLPFLAFLTAWNLAVPWVVDYHGESDRSNRQRMGGALAVIACSGLFLAFLASACHGLLEEILGFGIPRTGYFLMILSACLSSASLVYLELDKIRQESSRYLLASLVQTILQMGLSLGWVLWHQATFAAFLQAHTVACALVVAFQAARRREGTSPLFPSLRDTARLLRRGFPIALSTALALVASLGDRQFVHVAAGFAQVAIYSMGAKLGEIAQQLVLAPFLAALSPALLAVVHKEPEMFPVRFELEWRRYLGLSIFATTTLGASIDLLYRILLPAGYAAGIPVTLLFLLSFSIGGIGQMWATGVLVHGKLGVLMRVTATAAVSSLVFNALLTPRFHGLGAAFASVAVQTLACLQSWWIARGVGGYRSSSTTRGLILVAIAFPLAQLGSAWIFQGTVWSVVARGCLWGLGCIVLIRQGFLREFLSAVSRIFPPEHSRAG